MDTSPLASKRARKFLDIEYKEFPAKSSGDNVISLMAKNNMARSGPLFLSGMPRSIRFLEMMGIQAWMVLKYSVEVSTTVFHGSV